MPPVVVAESRFRCHSCIFIFYFFIFIFRVDKLQVLRHPDRLCETRHFFQFFGRHCLSVRSNQCDKIHKGMWLASILIINMLTMLTIAHADRGRPTLKDDERLFRNGLVRDIDNRTLMRGDVYSIKSMFSCFIESIKLMFKCVIELC